MQKDQTEKKKVIINSVSPLKSTLKRVPFSVFS